MGNSLTDSIKESQAKYQAKFYKPKLYFPPEMKDEISRYADQELMSVNKFILKAVKFYIKHLQKNEI